MKNFKKTKEYICKRAKKKQACSGEYRRALESKKMEDLISVIRDNASWTRENLLNDKKSLKYFGVSLNALMNSGNWNSGDMNSGDMNSGDMNSGNWNSGDTNSGDMNSGHRNSGDRNSGHRNSGNMNSGDRNSGNMNSGDTNSGNMNSGDTNSGNWNSGDMNSGDTNSGNMNSGDWNSGNMNSGDWNSGRRNSGFFNTKSKEIIDVFNKPCDIVVWQNSDKPSFIHNVNFNTWVSFSNMSDKEKKDFPKAFIRDGYLKTISYKEGWKNAFNKREDGDVEKLKNLPNWDAKVFEEITGLNIK